MMCTLHFWVSQHMVFQGVVCWAGAPFELSFACVVKKLHLRLRMAPHVARCLSDPV